MKTPGVLFLGAKVGWAGCALAPEVVLLLDFFFDKCFDLLAANYESNRSNKASAPIYSTEKINYLYSPSIGVMKKTRGVIRTLNAFCFSSHVHP